MSKIYKSFENQQSGLLNIAVDSNRLLSYSYPDYTKGVDEIYIVIDRDPQSGISNHVFLETIHQALEKKYNVLLSNPCFEFWLLLHHKSKFSKEEVSRLKTGLIHGEKQNVAFNMLKKIDSNYTKKLPNVEMYVAKVKDAINNSKAFSTNLDDLVSNIGSNIGTFLEENLVLAD